MKSTTVAIVAGLFLSLTSTVDAQTLSLTAALNPLKMIEMLEAQLGAQFESVSESAIGTTVQIMEKGAIVAHGSIISGRDHRFNYLVFPADAISSTSIAIKALNGTLVAPISSGPIQILSREDNLAIMRLSANTTSIHAHSAHSVEVGSFIGIKNSEGWKTGAVSNASRSAFTGVDSGIEKALSKHWNRIGLKVNEKRAGFPEVMETDLALDPSEAGAPVFDRDGNWTGIAISRVDQHSTYVVPATRLSHLIAKFEAAHS